MRWLPLIALALAACAPGAAVERAATGGPVATPLIRTAATSSGQPLRLPQGPAELVGTIVVIPVGAVLPLHQHPWSRFAYVEEGIVRVINRDTQQSRDFSKGEVIVEAVGQWHEGRSVGTIPVRLVVFDLVPPGVNNIATGAAGH